MDGAANRTILLVEDDLLSARVVRAVLERAGYAVRIVSKGEDALRLAEAEPDLGLVLMDIDLGPGMDGVAAAAELLRRRELPVLFLSARADAELLGKLESVGSYGFVPKGSENAVLLASVSMAFSLAEARRREARSAERYRLLFEQSPQGAIVAEADTGRFLQANPAICAMFGYGEQEFLSLGIADLHPAEQVPDVVGKFRAMAAGKTSSSPHVPCVRRDGTRFYADISSAIMELDGIRCLIGFFVDVSGHERERNALMNRIGTLTGPSSDLRDVRFEDLFDMEDIQRLQDEFAAATGVASIITKPDGTPLTSPSNFCRFCSDIVRGTEHGRENCYRSDAVLGQYRPEGPYVHPCLSGGLWDAGAGIALEGRPIANWLIGQVRDELQTEGAVRDYARTIGADEEEALAAFMEVPAMSRTRFDRIAQVLFTLANQLSTIAFQNVRQARQIAYQETILKETHHRIKNNIAAVESAITMNLPSVQDPKALSILTDAAGRVESMRQIYEKLLSTEDYRSVSAGEYLGDLIGAVRALFSGRDAVRLETHIEDLELPVNQLFPLGTIVNELLTNAMKYAFPDGSAGTIRIDLSRVGRGARLTVEDDGRGFAPGVDPSASTGFGLMLVRMLAEQLGGGYRTEGPLSRRSIIQFPLG